MNLINRQPVNWYQVRWPYPKASYVRQNSDCVDRQGRSYMRMSEDDIEHEELHGRTNAHWYWVAHPYRKQVPILNNGDMVCIHNPAYSLKYVYDTVNAGMPRRTLYIVQM